MLKKSPRINPEITYELLKRCRAKREPPPAPPGMTISKIIEMPKYFIIIIEKDNNIFSN